MNQIQFFNKVEYQSQFEHVPNQQLNAEQLERKIEILEEFYHSWDATMAEIEEEQANRIDDILDEHETEVIKYTEKLSEYEEELEKLNNQIEKLQQLNNNEYKNNNMKTIQEWEQIVIKDVRRNKSTKSDLIEQIAMLQQRCEEYYKENKELREQEEQTQMIVEQTPVDIKVVKKINIDLVEYNEKSFALFGEQTKEYKETIKTKLKGRFNPRLRRNGEAVPGWIISNKYLDVAKELFN